MTTSSSLTYEWVCKGWAFNEPECIPDYPHEDDTGCAWELFPKPHHELFPEPHNCALCRARLRPVPRHRDRS